MNKELKPCPFCGNIDLCSLDVDERATTPSRYVECNKCYAKGPDTISCHSTSEAIAAWNKRSEG